MSNTPTNRPRQLARTRCSPSIAVVTTTIIIRGTETTSITLAERHRQQKRLGGVGRSPGKPLRPSRHQLQALPQTTPAEARKACDKTITKVDVERARKLNELASHPTTDELRDDRLVECVCVQGAQTHTHTGIQRVKLWFLIVIYDKYTSKLI